jgi:ketosteroid isomerase-like protein
MKLSAVILSVFVGLAVPSHATTQSNDANIAAVMNAFLVPFSNQDVAAFIDYFADDAVVFFPSAQFATMRVEGKPAIARAFEGVFKPGRPVPPGGRPLIQPQDLKVQGFGDMALVTFHLGNDTTRGRRTFVLRRIDSKWRIVHLHASTISAP